MEVGMEPRIFHGNLNPSDLADVLVGEFSRGNLRVQKYGNEDQMVVQIATLSPSHSGGNTGLAVTVKKAPDGVSVVMGDQAWLGVAASIGQTAMATLMNPWNLLGRLDDVAQDIESISLSDEVWKVIERAARTAGASFELSERFRRLECVYCGTGNPIGEPRCIACGAPLGGAQPQTCKHCGFVLQKGESICPNCRQRVED
jgi:hypothetical protein